jgi:ribosome maturation factor RimP
VLGNVTVVQANKVEDCGEPVSTRENAEELGDEVRLEAIRKDLEVDLDRRAHRVSVDDLADASTEVNHARASSTGERTDEVSRRVLECGTK